MRCVFCEEDKPLSAFDVMEQDEDGPICYDCADDDSFSTTARIAIVALVVIITAIGVAGKMYLGS